MIEIGKYNTLKILRSTAVGLYLTDGEKDVLLPNKYVPKQYEIEEEIEVFVYLDHEERPVATTLEPYIFLNEFSLLRVSYVNKFGAFMNWGLEKDLFVPFKEQARPMEEGKRYLVYMYLDQQTNRLVGSSRLNQFLNNQDMNLENGEEVDLIISHISDTGINVIINEKHKGLIYKNEIFEDLRTGDRIVGYIKNIRPDGKIDVSRHPLGFERIDTSAQKIIDELKAGRGVLKLHDNSSPDDIKTILQMSKKTFKKAIGILYKQKMIELKPDGIYLLKE
ncbi:GntR family transcriptional regulator [Flavobacterium davisii]|uniref:GntR family transcriptional regulator n=1 Tax=Flavobacterium davisii TaxID=2906077 RepID=A0A246GJ88_9FLAO|nr:S1-like domain-containing RNA-binding protein [Flavobacterium davisii]OWP84305.1 GntR family transcriptional regulator [Flavobacterium davisii]